MQDKDDKQNQCWLTKKVYEGEVAALRKETKRATASDKGKTWQNANFENLKSIWNYKKMLF